MKYKKNIKAILIHSTLLVGIAIITFPIYIAFIASTHSVNDLLRSPIPILPGTQFIQNYSTVLGKGILAAGGNPIWEMLFNSALMAFFIAIGKIIFSIGSAYSIVYFRFPFRKLFFTFIFLTLMLPVQVRIVPTFLIAAKLDLLNSYVGLSLPLIASATATFLFRQFFLTIPDELVEAARLDGAGPWRFFTDILLPLSRTNIAALFVVMFIYGWNQYLWPLVITTDPNMSTIVMGIQKLANIADQVPQWHLIMATAILAMLPPILVIIIMQKQFVRGLVETEK